MTQKFSEEQEYNNVERLKRRLAMLEEELQRRRLERAIKDEEYKTKKGLIVERIKGGIPRPLKDVANISKEAVIVGGKVAGGVAKNVYEGVTSPEFAPARKSLKELGAIAFRAVHNAGTNSPYAFRRKRRGK